MYHELHYMMIDIIIIIQPQDIRCYTGHLEWTIKLILDFTSIFKTRKSLQTINHVDRGLGCAPGRIHLLPQGR